MRFFAIYIVHVADRVNTVYLKQHSGKCSSSAVFVVSLINSKPHTITIFAINRLEIVTRWVGA